MIVSIWIEGASRSGKTTHLLEEFRYWVEQELDQRNKAPAKPDSLATAILVFAANNHNRRQLTEQLSEAIVGSYPVMCKTPVGFICDEVELFWPLIFQRLNLKAQFPLRLRPEREQELATQLWRSHLDKENLRLSGVGEHRLIRRTLDLLQLAAANGISTEEIPGIMGEGLPGSGWDGADIANPTATEDNVAVWQRLGELLVEWREWCLARGLLTYGIVYELYWRYLLPDPTYQSHLTRRFRAVFADDTDNYPGIARDLFDFLLDQGAFGVFTYNPNGKVRLGLNADPNYLAGLAHRCRVVAPPPPLGPPHWGRNRENKAISRVRSQRTTIPIVSSTKFCVNPDKVVGLGLEVQETAIALLTEPGYIGSFPEQVQSIQTISRAELLRQTAEAIARAVEQKQVAPEEIAIVAPGLDEIARYSFIEILSHRGIAVEPLNEQRPLIAYPIIRALLTLLAVIYPGLGRLVNRDEIAEMLVVLSSKPKPEIDQVRGGLLADHCYNLDATEELHLLSVESFPRWDRLGYKANKAYNDIKAWIEQTKSLHREEGFLNPIILLDQAIKHYFGHCNSYHQLAALRELMETAQHYWEVDRRLRQNEPSDRSPTATIGEFIQLLRRGTITANPRPQEILGQKEGAVTLATIFQYRSLRSFHRWHFWLDAGSVLWERGDAATLFAAPLFLKEWNGRAWMPEDEVEAGKQLLERVLRDLLVRVGERLYLCHSDLGVNGREQMGPLLSLVRGAREVSP